MKNICIVVDPVSTGAFLPHALRAYGLRAIAVITDGEASAAMRRFVPEHFDAVIHLKGIEWPPELDSEKILRIVAGSDLGVISADRLAEQGRTPNRNPITLTEARRDKFLMGEAISNNGLPHVLQAQFSDSNQLARWLDNTGLTNVVLKPRMSMASDMVRICRSQSEALFFASKILGATDILGNRNSSVLAQEFVVGDEYMLDTVSVDGRHSFVAAWEAVRSRSGTPLPDYADSIDSSHPKYSALSEYCRSVLNVIGVRNGPAHTEIIVHPRRGPLLVEVNARFHGALNLLFPTSIYGTNQVVETAKSIAKPESFVSEDFPPLRQLMFGRKVYLHSQSSGIIKKALNVTRIAALPTVMSVEPRRTVGQRLEVTESLSTSPGTVFLLSTDQSLLARDHQQIRNIEYGLFAEMVS